MIEPSPVSERMQMLINQWEQNQDRRSIFLSCYSLMTHNMLQAIAANDFHDSAWISELLQHFADYYFTALDAYEQGSSQTPAVWQLAFDAAHHPHTMVLQNLMVGINAHINYDLILAIGDLLTPEWNTLTTEQRELRYQDHCHVNDIIAQTVDIVQDQVVDKYEPAMKVVDIMFGRLDEWMISKLIQHWRDRVWQEAIQMAESPLQAREAIRRKLEASSVIRGNLILLEGVGAAIEKRI